MRLRTKTFLLATFLFYCLIPQKTGAASNGSPPTKKESGRVILIALDGVRWQDFFDVPGSRIREDDPEPQPFSAYHKVLLERGVAFGNREQGSRVRMTLSGFFSRRKSLPSYQAILAGFAQPCADNACPRIAVETLPESVARRRQLPAEKVAVIASWPGLARAAARNPDGIHLDAGEPPNTEDPTAELVIRDDARTVEVALNHLKKHSPEFLFVVLDSADHAGHEGDRLGYVEALRGYDATLLRFLSAIEAMGPEEARRTTLIVTTDHGRGSWGNLWKIHGLIYNAQDVFITATGPHIERPDGRNENARTLYHADLRPTIEILLGLSPTECTHSTCGRAIKEIIPADR